MNKKLFCVSLACVLSVGIVASGCGGQKEGVELPHYDQSADQNYNPDLFYRNDMTTYSADPSVLWVSKEQDAEYGGYFYMYSTDNVQNFGVHRSRDAINWEYVQVAFMPERSSWAQDRMYAPECVYDATEEKYYLFFSASWQGREGDYLYNSYAEKAEYEKIESDVKRYNLVAAQGKIDEYKTKFASEDPSEGYTAEEWNNAKKALAIYEELLKEGDGSDDESEMPDAQKLELVKSCLISVGTVRIHKKASVECVHSIGVAVSDSPVGPFVQYTNASDDESFNDEAREISVERPFFTHEDFYEALAGFQENGETEKYNALKAVLPERMIMIDADPFLDPKTGKKYIYFSSVQPSQEYIFGMQLGDHWTDDPLWETLTPVTRYGYQTVNGSETIDYPQGINRIEEGPHMLYDGDTDTYYLTFSINGAYEKEYAVGQATGKTPLGTFTKIPMENGGLVIASDSLWDHVAGPGHHCFLQYEGKMYIFYQGLYERANNTSNKRGICVDEVKSFVNDKGEKVFNANGPTYAPMPKIGPDAQYYNIADQANISVNRGENKEALNDGLLNVMNHHDLVSEFSAGKGKTTITLSFDDYKTIRAIMVFNARDKENWFEKIDRIELDFIATDDEGKEIQETAYMKDLAFNKELYTGLLGSRPGGSVCTEFNEIKVKTIRITIDSDKAFSISEIYVLGK